MCVFLRWTVWNYDPCRTVFIMFWQSRTRFLKRTGSEVAQQLCWTAFPETLWLYRSLCAFSLNSTCASFLNSTECVLLPTTSRDINNFKDGLATTTSISTLHVHKNNLLLKLLSERLTSRLLTPVLTKGPSSSRNVFAGHAESRAQFTSPPAFLFFKSWATILP